MTTKTDKEKKWERVKRIEQMMYGRMNLIDREQIILEALKTKLEKEHREYEEMK